MRDDSGNPIPYYNVKEPTELKDGDIVYPATIIPIDLDELERQGKSRIIVEDEAVKELKTDKFGIPIPFYNVSEPTELPNGDIVYPAMIVPVKIKRLDKYVASTNDYGYDEVYFMIQPFMTSSGELKADVGAYTETVNHIYLTSVSGTAEATDKLSGNSWGIRSFNANSSGTRKLYSTVSFGNAPRGRQFNISMDLSFEYDDIDSGGHMDQGPFYYEVNYTT